MTITKSMVCDILSQYQITEYIAENAAFSFERAEFLSGDSGSFSPAVLYISTAEQLEQVECPEMDGICILCQGSDGFARELLGRRKLSLLLFPEDIDFFEVANKLLKGLFRLNSWENKIKTIIASREPIQNLIEAGADIFGENPLVLLSVSFNVVGRSMDSTAYNERVNRLLQRGYLTQEESDIMSRMGYPLHREDYREAMRVDPPTYMGCSFFLIAFPSSMKQAAFFTVYFVATEPTQGLLDIFRYYSALVQDYIKSQLKPGEQMPSALEMFMDDILLHTNEDRAYLSDRAKQLQLPLNEPYRVGLIQWEAYSRDQADYVLWRVRSVLGNSVYRIMRYHDSILLLMKGSVSHSNILKSMDETADKLSGILSVCNGYLGFSPEVDNLFKLDVAYKQACSAAKYGKMVAGDEKLYFYSEYYIYDMIDSYSSRFGINDMFVQKLRLLENKDEGSFNNLNLLRCYLMSERNLSVTARLLHMHRNSVIYRISKISDILGVDMDEPDVRLRLLISFKILEMINGRKFPPLHSGDNTDQ